MTMTKTTQPPRRKWSGDEEPQSYYCHDDDEHIVTLTVDEQRRIQLNHANAQRKWRNSDEDNNDRRVVAEAEAIVRAIKCDETPAPPRASSKFWTTPWLIASGDEPVYEPEYEPVFEPEHDDDEPEHDDDEPEHNDDEPEEESASATTHVPFVNLTKKQRADKSELFRFGLCSDCDAGLGDRSDFVCEPSRPTGAFVMRCNACHDYYQQVWLKRVGCECAGCN